MKLSLLLHLYQPPTQDEAALRKVVSECYTPLFKLIKNHKDHQFTINTPLSLLELLDRYGYYDLLSTTKELVESERVELVGSAAYHALLTKYPKKLIQNQVILNEYSLGYYFGSRQGFEGDKSIMIKNLKGFFPPEMAVTNKTLLELGALGYEWVIVDSPAIPQNAGELLKKYNTFELAQTNLKIVVRDTVLSNIISFRRTNEVSDIISYIGKSERNSIVVAMDGEAFGHHNKEGIHLLDFMLNELKVSGIKTITVSSNVEDSYTTELSEINESSWAIPMDLAPTNIYPYWEKSEHVLHSLLWELQGLVIDFYLQLDEFPRIDGFENIKLWDINTLKSEVNNPEVLKKLLLDNWFSKSLHSDQFWWASKEQVFDTTLYDPAMIVKALELYAAFAEVSGQELLIKKVTEISQKILDHLRSEN